MIGFQEGVGGEASEFPELVGAVTEAFSPTGWIAQATGLEHRSAQEEMAISVAQAWLADEALLIEAGTGVGKSLAYLLPGIMRAVQLERPLVVSTHTIALQEQILHHDLDLVRKLFQQHPELEKAAQFRSTLLVGRGNYLCGTRLAQAEASRGELFPTEEQKELERLRAWIPNAVP